MKKIGIAAAILIVALLMTGAVSALAASEKSEKITITQIGPDTAKTSDGQQIFTKRILAADETQGKIIMIKGGSSKPETLTTIDGQVFKVIYHDVNKDTQIGTKGGGSGSVAPGYVDIWGSYSWTAGKSVSESATWTPTNQNVYLGIYDSITDNGPFLEYSGGSGSFSTSVPWTSSDWGYAIANPGPQTIYYTITF